MEDVLTCYPSWLFVLLSICFPFQPNKDGQWRDSGGLQDG
jgi:hypothetical protein